MATLHFLSEYDRLQAYKKYRAILDDMDQEQLLEIILFLINGADLDYAIDTAMSFKKRD